MVDNETTIRVYPELNMDPDNTGSDTHRVVHSYYAKPTSPNWGYVVIGDKALYNGNTSTNFDLHASEEEFLVIRILELAGVVMKNPHIQQSAMVDKANTNKEQNN